MSVHIEQEIKLQAPRRFDLSALADGINGLTSSAIQAHKLSTIYYDTDDLRLTRWGCSLRLRRGQGWTLKLPAASENGSLARVEHTFVATGTKPPAKALELVAAFLRGRAVGPVARLRTVRKSLRLHGVSGEEIAEIADDDVRVMSDGRVVDRFREIEVELLNGAPTSMLDGLRRSLQDAGAGVVDETPKSVRALGAPALTPPELYCARPSGQSPAADVIRYALASSVEMLMRADAPLRLNMDPEAVHQARVATRKLRSDLRTFGPLLREEWVRSLRGKIKWFTDELGAVRDADVLVGRLRRWAARLSAKNVRAVEAVIERFAKESHAARAELAGVLREKRYLELLNELVDAAADPRVEQPASEPAIDVLPRLVEVPWKKLCKAITALNNKAGDEQLHRVRIKAKRCRYAAEAIVPVGGKPIVRFARRVQRFQRILGELHDAVVAEQRLREIKGDREDIFAAGTLAAMESLAADEARSSWRKAWKKASKKSLRSWM